MTRKYLQERRRKALEDGARDRSLRCVICLRAPASTVIEGTGKRVCSDSCLAEYLESLEAR